ncbi:hypothetical protein LMTR13_09775 [Bradyrhizobium icense]|uniref:Uncharacterized protein n=1 Tax=Bradyrhizobium icense TaxID=1274631 RepID=A0A1B1URJ1_9BRAD|nr:hypothetical protein LMTR13_09775 [Bradyrhizobium icense]
MELGAQFETLAAELSAAQHAASESISYSDQWSCAKIHMRAGVDARAERDAGTRQIEAILARLDPIERAIMQTQACTISGLGVKARHAAYVMSQYWEAPIDQIDWETRAVRLLIEAVCDVARTPLPLRNERSND